MQKRRLEIQCDNIDKRRQWIFPAVFNYLTEQPFDVMFKIGENLIPAHKTILSATSPFFMKMFKDQEVRDSKSRGESYIRLEGVSYDRFYVVLDLIYNGHVNITEEEIAEVIKTAEKLQIGFFCPAIPEPPEESDEEEEVESSNSFFSEEVDQQDETNVQEIEALSSSGQFTLKHELSEQPMENSDKENSELFVSRRIETRQRSQSSSVKKCEPLDAIESCVKEEVNEDHRCRHCSKILASDKNRIRHERRCKFKSEMECPVCSMQFDSQLAMNPSELSSATSQPRLSSVCGFKFLVCTVSRVFGAEKIGSGSW